MATKKMPSAEVFSIGDRVEIAHFGTGEISEFRGPLGPGGEQVYRVCYRRKPRAGYIEVLASQIRHATVVKGGKTPAAKLAPPGVDAPGA